MQQRPGNADLAASLKGTGVLASLSVLFTAAGAESGAESLRSAALCCAASSRELHSWMLAVPGVAKTLTGGPGVGKGESDGKRGLAGKGALEVNRSRSPRNLLYR